MKLPYQATLYLQVMISASQKIQVQYNLNCSLLYYKEIQSIFRLKQSMEFLKTDTWANKFYILCLGKFII